ncbi:MAG: HEAT repeat domain-containing protein [Myxococcales bacterium]|nr:HEAT repeat domain-containing protein [Myxococcales bacterium]
MWGLFFFGNEAAASPVGSPLEHLRNLVRSSPERRKQAQQYFRAQGPRALPWLRKALRSPNPRLRREVLRLLRPLKHAALPAAPELLEILAYASGPLRLATVDVLLRIGPSLLPTVNAIAQDPTAPDAKRTAAVLLIGYFGAPSWSSTPLLIEIIREEDDARLRNVAIWAVGRIGPLAKQAIPILLYALTVRRLTKNTIVALSKMGPAVLPHLRPLLYSPSPHMRRRIIKVVGHLGSIGFSLRLPLINSLNDHYPSIRRAAAKSLLAMGPRVIPALRLAIREGHWRKKANIAYTIGLFKEKAIPAQGELVQAAQDPAWQVRRSAAFALGSLGPQARQASTALFGLLYDPSFRVRQHSLIALKKLHLPMKELQPPIEKLFETSRDPYDLHLGLQLLTVPSLRTKRLAAARKLLRFAKMVKQIDYALKEIRSFGPAAVSALPELMDAIERRELASQQREISRTLLAIGAPALPMLLSILRGKHHQLQRRTLQVAGYLRGFSEKILPELKRLSKDSPFHIASTAMLSLGRLRQKGKAGLPVLRLALYSKDYRYRLTASRSLRMMGDAAESLLPDIQVLTHDIHWGIREQAMRLLGQLPLSSKNRSNVFERLQQGLLDEDQIVRRYALTGLIQQGYPSELLRRILHRHLLDSSYKVRKLAIRTLKKISPQEDPQKLIRAYRRAQRFVMRRALPPKQRQLALYVDRAPNQQVLARWGEIEALGTKGLSLLRYTLTHHRRSVQIQTLQTLYKMGSVVSPLFPNAIALMGNPRTDSQVQRGLIRLLQQDIRHALPLLKQALHSPDVKIAREACATLADIPQYTSSLIPSLIFTLRRRYVWNEARRALIQQKQKALPLLFQALDHPHLLIRARVLEILSHQPQHLVPILPKLRAALKHPFLQMRWKATDTLQKIGPAALPALPDLIPLLHDRESFVRWRAARAIGEIGPRAAKAIPALLRRLDTKDRRLKKYLRLSLKKIGGPQDPKQLFQSLQHPLPDVRAYAARILAQLQEDAAPALPTLQKAFRDPSQKVRKLAILAYAQIAPPSAKSLSTLLNGMLDAHPTEHPAYHLALRALLKRNPNLADSLQPLQSSSLRPLREAAKLALAQEPVDAPTSQPSSRPTSSTSQPSSSTLRPTSLQPTSLRPFSPTSQPSPPPKKPIYPTSQPMLRSRPLR